MSNETLLPCPFCGGKAVFLRAKQGSPAVIIGCECCTASLGMFPCEADAAGDWNTRLSSTSPVVPDADDTTRDIAGETVLGFRVAAYRETHPEYGDKYGHAYSEHWSTPNSRNPAVKVERLFTEAQLRAAVVPDERLREALEWYGEQARLCRLIHSEGDAGRQALDADGGKRARAALNGEG